MKKTLAVVLTLLVAFSMFSVAASAATVSVEDADFVVTFMKDGIPVGTVGYSDLANAEAADFPDEEIVPQQYEADKYDEESKENKRYRYKFVGWRSEVDGQLYYPGTLSKHPATEKYITLVAEYSVEDLSERQTFWQLIESILARINLIFEYFATIFNF